MDLICETKSLPASIFTPAFVYTCEREELINTPFIISA
jgi:hypothetical protein